MSPRLLHIFCFLSSTTDVRILITHASRLPSCFPSKLNAPSVLPTRCIIVPHSICTIPFHDSDSASFSASWTTQSVLPLTIKRNRFQSRVVSSALGFYSWEHFLLLTESDFWAEVGECGRGGQWSWRGWRFRSRKLKRRSPGERRSKRLRTNVGCVRICGWLGEWVIWRVVVYVPPPAGEWVHLWNSIVLWLKINTVSDLPAVRMLKPYWAVSFRSQNWLGTLLEPSQRLSKRRLLKVRGGHLNLCTYQPLLGRRSL